MYEWNVLWWNGINTKWIWKVEKPLQLNFFQLSFKSAKLNKSVCDKLLLLFFFTDLTIILRIRILTFYFIPCGWHVLCYYSIVYLLKAVWKNLHIGWPPFCFEKNKIIGQKFCFSSFNNILFCIWVMVANFLMLLFFIITQQDFLWIF